MNESTTLPRVGQERQKEEQTAPLYNVVLLNDDDHSYDYVIEMLQKIFCFSVQQAYQHAVEVDLTERTVLITCALEEAEFGRDQIHAYGPDPRIARSKGSMSAIIERAAE
jgi:ATP-dependent Clp protease adaptor protein ClpS